jgi:hypothetical protein
MEILLNNLPKAYHYSSERWIYFLIIWASNFFIFLVAGDYERGFLTLTTLIIAGSPFLVYILRYRVTVLPFGIAVRRWWKETFFAWETIQSLDIESRKLRLYRDADTWLSISLDTHGYDEIWENLRMKRPELAQTLRKFHGRETSALISIIYIVIYLGILILGVMNFPMDPVRYGGSAILVVVFALLIRFGITFRSIEIGETELIIHYPLSEKRISVTDITTIRKGSGLEVGSSQTIHLGKVMEGKAALYANLLDWWRAGKRQQ